MVVGVVGVLLGVINPAVTPEGVVDWGEIPTLEPTEVGCC